MRWSVMGLLATGLAAAVCAGALVAFWRPPSGAEGGTIHDAEPEKVEVLVAAASMPALKVVDAASVAKKKVPRGHVPGGYIADSGRVVGRVLSAAMAEGQIFTDSCFADQGYEKRLASMLRGGMRAVSVSLSEHSRVESLLLPGSSVDVLALLRAPSAGGLEETISTTLLQGVQVLAVGDRTLVSTGQGREAGDQRSRHRTQKVVTLMVSPAQAKTLQLAMEHGTISLALRSPSDAALVRDKPVRLSDIIGLPAGRSRPLKKTAGETRPASQPHPRRRPPRQWRVTVIRGDTLEVQPFPEAEDQKEKTGRRRLDGGR